MKIKSSFLILFTIGVLWLPTVTFAQEGSIMSAYQGALELQEAQLVSCSGWQDCNFCSFGVMVNNIINWLFGFLTIAAVLILAFAGFKLVTSGGDTDAMRWAKERITYVIIGFLLMLASWLIIDTILRGLTGSERGMEYWGTFDVDNCGFVREPESENYDEYELVDHSYENDLQDTFTGNSGPDDGFRGGNSIVPSGELTSYAGYQYDSAVVGNVQELAASFNLRVTSGYRSPERNKAVNGSPTSYHLTGRAADFVGSASDMQAAADYARANGAREVLIHDAGSGTHLHVGW